MVRITPQSTVRDFQDFIQEVYGVHNDRYFSYVDLLASLEKFSTKIFRAVRKGEKDEAIKNSALVAAWVMSIGNQSHIDIENELVARYPGVCQKCHQETCVCFEKNKKIAKNRKPVLSTRLHDVQGMFEKIYPHKRRTLEQAALHLAEKMGELSESITAGNVKHIKTACADFLSCLFGVTNSLESSLGEALSREFVSGCHVCHETPCRCSLSAITKITSVL